MRLLDHLSITVRDLSVCAPFYKAVMNVLGAPLVYEREDAIGFGERNRAHDDGHSYLSVFQSPAAAPDLRRHVCLRAASRAQVEAFHAGGLAAGGSDAGAPGPRTHYHPDYYAAFLFDPEGNKLEAVFHRTA